MNVSSIISPAATTVYLKGTRQAVHWLGRMGGADRPDLSGADMAYARSVVLGAEGDLVELDMGLAVVAALTQSEAAATLTIGSGENQVTYDAASVSAAGNEITVEHAAVGVIVAGSLTSNGAAAVVFPVIEPSVAEGSYACFLSHGDDYDEGTGMGTWFRLSYKDDAVPYWLLAKVVDEVNVASWEKPVGAEIYPHLADWSGSAVAPATGTPTFSYPSLKATTDVEVTGQAIVVTPGSMARMWVIGTLTSDGSTPVVFPEMPYQGTYGGRPFYRHITAEHGYSLSWEAGSAEWRMACGSSVWTSTSDVPTPDLAIGWTPDSPSTGIPVVRARTSSAAQTAAAVNDFPAAFELVTAIEGGSGTGAVATAAATHLSGGVDASMISGVDGLDHEGNAITLSGLRGLYVACAAGGATLSCGTISIPIPAGSDLDLRFSEADVAWLENHLTLTATADSTALALVVIGQQGLVV